MVSSRKKKRKRDAYKKRNEALRRVQILFAEIALERVQASRNQSERGTLNEKKVVAAFHKPHLRPSWIKEVRIASAVWNHYGVDIVVIMANEHALYLQIKSSRTGVSAFYARYACIAGRLIEVVIIDPYEPDAVTRRKVLRAAHTLRSRREAQFADVMGATA